MSARKKIIPIFVPHAGCPNNCVFCNQKRISGSLFPADEKVVDAALSALPDNDDYELAFYGGSFTAIPVNAQKSLLDCAHHYFRTGKISSVRLSTRPDAISERILEFLKQYPVTTIELGAQSMNDDVLICSGRGHSADDTRKASSLIRSYNFSLVLQMMTGLPGSDRAADIYTAEQLALLAPNAVRIYPTVIIRDTMLEYLWKTGAYKEHTVEDAIDVCAQIVPIFKSKGIPVIRLGLNPTEELSGGDALAGAYHPALGEMIRSRMILNQISELAGKKYRNQTVLITVPSQMLSAAIGQHRSNLEAIKASLEAEKIIIRSSCDEEIKIHRCELK